MPSSHSFHGNEQPLWSISVPLDRVNEQQFPSALHQVLRHSDNSLLLLSILPAVLRFP